MGTLITDCDSLVEDQSKVHHECHSFARELLKDNINIGDQLSSGRRCHIVVGGGTSGIMLCNQLLEQDDVILIERGSSNPHSKQLTSRIPNLWPAAAISAAEATRESTLAQNTLGQRHVMYPQGSGLGGTSNINAMIWTAGHPAVFDNHWHPKWNSEIFFSLLRTVKGMINPRKNHSPLIGLLANNSGCSIVQECENSSAATKEIDSSATAEASTDQLIWDKNAIKASYLATIDRETNDRINLRKFLFNNDTPKGCENIPGSGVVVEESISKLDQNADVGRENRPRRGRLSIVEHCTVVSVQFEDIPEEDFKVLRTGISGKPSERVEVDTSGHRRAVEGKVESTIDTARLRAVAVAVNYLDGKTGSKERLIKPTCGGEIVLCAGAFESPRILLSSGLGGRGPGPTGPNSTAPGARGAREDFKAGGSRGPGHTDSPADVYALIRPDGPGFPPTLPVTLRGIGRNLQDHTVLPIMCLGKWWTQDRPLAALKKRLNSIDHTGGLDATPAPTSKAKANNDLKQEGLGQYRTLDPPILRPPSSGGSVGSVGSAASIGCVGSVSGSGCVGYISSAVCVGVVGYVLAYTFAALQGSQTSEYWWCPTHSYFTDLKAFPHIFSIPEMLTVQSLTDPVLPVWTSNPALLTFAAIFLIGVGVFTGINGRKSGRNEPYPPNCVHGYVNLDADGHLLRSDSDTAPSAQLLLVDGSLSPGYLLPELLLPRYASSSCVGWLYMSAVRPYLTLFLRMILHLPPFTTAAGCTFGFLVCNVQPYSRGRLIPHTDSSGRTLDLAAPLLIEHGLLTDQRDVKVLFHAMKTARKLLRGLPLTPPTFTPPATASDLESESTKKVPLVCVEVLPGPLFGDTEEEGAFLKYAQTVTTTYFHACGTCAMETGRNKGMGKGEDEGEGGRDSREAGNARHDGEGHSMAVVDADLRVRGVWGLRVGDASVFPRISSGPTSATCMALGIALGRLILAERGRDGSD